MRHSGQPCPLRPNGRRRPRFRNRALDGGRSLHRAAPPGPLRGPAEAGDPRRLSRPSPTVLCRGGRVRARRASHPGHPLSHQALRQPRRQEQPRLGQDLLPQRRDAGTVRDHLHRLMGEVGEAAQRPVHAEERRRVGPPEGDVAADRLADLLLPAGDVAQVVGDLVGLAEIFAEEPPAHRLGPGRRRARHGRGGKERAGLGLLVDREPDLRLGFPGLPRHDAGGRAHRPGHQPDQGREARRPARRTPGQGLEGQHDQGVAGEERHRLAIGDVDRRLLAPQGRVVEARQVVMDQRGAVQKFDRGRCRVRRRRIVVAAGTRHREAEPRPDAVPAREHGVADRLRQARRCAGRLRVGHGHVERPLDAPAVIHEAVPMATREEFHGVSPACHFV